MNREAILLAQRTARFRKANGISQRGLAKMADLSRSTIQDVENGVDAKLHTVTKLAKAMGVSISDLAGYNEAK